MTPCNIPEHAFFFGRPIKEIDPRKNRKWSNGDFVKNLGVDLCEAKKLLNLYHDLVIKNEKNGCIKDPHNICWNELKHHKDIAPIVAKVLRYGDGPQCLHLIGMKLKARYRDRQQKKNQKKRTTQGIPEGIGSASHPAAISTRWDTLIWVAVPDKLADWTIKDSWTLGVEVFLVDSALGSQSWMKNDEIDCLKKRLGKAFLSKSDESVVLHQGVATMLLLRSQSNCSVELYSWAWFSKAVREGSLYTQLLDSNGQAKSAVLFLHWTTQEPQNMSLDDVYKYIRSFAPIHGANVRPYPSESEHYHERSKLGDLRALDEIAGHSDWKFAYRLITCYGQRCCQLAGHQTTVHKRTYSGCADHVKIQSNRRRDGLTCTLEHPNTARKSSKKAVSPSSPQYWFHQEYISTLQTFGEFRVFIVTESCATGGRRGRRGKIIAAVRTKWIWEEKRLIAEAVEEDTFRREECRGLEIKDLYEYCLYFFERLRARDDALTHYESLETGVRLDVGISDEMGRKRFFVLELTRWYGAHFFSSTACAEPKTQICKAFATAFHDTHFGEERQSRQAL